MTHPTDPRLAAVMQQAVATGLIPADTPPPAMDARPWPIVLLTGLGAWLAAVPLTVVVGMLLGDVVTRGAGSYVVGLLVLAGALTVLHSRSVPAFVEQLAVPGLLVGGATLGFGLFRDLPDTAAFVALGAVALAAAVLVRAAWLRGLLGAAAATMLALGLGQDFWRGSSSARLSAFWFAWHGCAAAWLALHAWGDRLKPHTAAIAEPVGAGWLLATLCGLAAWAGMSFLVGATFDAGSRGLASELLTHTGWMQRAQQGASMLLAAVGTVCAAQRWPALRAPWLRGVAAVLVLLAAWMPTLGAVLLLLALCVTSARLRLAAAAAGAAAWIIGAFYYQLAWPLAHKAVLLVGAGALLAALARWGQHGPAAAPPAPPVSHAPGHRRWGIALCAAAVLAVANFGIWQKESLIAEGRPVFVELAPVDPRSLMQGDFMRLNFRVPMPGQERFQDLARGERPRVVGQLDARGVLTLRRTDDGTPLAADELRIELTPKDGRWVLVTDAWFFAEGEAARWSGARFGEFRVLPDGRALLVGLRGPALEPL